MGDNQAIALPASGLAEDVLSSFLAKAQAEENLRHAATTQAAAKIFYHLVTFHLGREEFGVEIGSVQEIIRSADITTVPGAQSHVKGVINLRGKIIPVVDLRKRFHLAENEASELQRIIVVELGEKRLGLLVDSVSQVIKVPVEVVESIPEEATSIDDNYIQGIGKLNDRLIIILDLNRSLLL